MSHLVFIDTALMTAPAIILPGGDVITLRNPKNLLSWYSFRICRDRVLVMDGDKVIATFAGVYAVLVPGDSRVEECP